MNSEVMICNLALSNIGKTGINSLEEASSEALAQLLVPSSSAWTRAYQRPHDCLKISGLIDHPFRCNEDPRSHNPAYTLVGDTILCDLSPAFLDYTARMIDPAYYPVLFTQALSWQLSARISIPMTQDPRLRADIYQMAVSAFNKAASHDANEAHKHFDHLTI